VNQTKIMPLQTEWDVAPIRAEARRLAKKLGFGSKDQQIIDLCIVELATNTLIHANGGTISLNTIQNEKTAGLQITCNDEGPGIENCELALTNGWSSKGSLGLGLPSVRRLSDEFEIHSAANRGTKIIVKKWVTANDNLEQLCRKSNPDRR